MIANIIGKIKAWLKENEKDVVLAIGVFFIAVISFGLGALTKIGDNAPIIVEDSKYGSTSLTTGCATSSLSTSQIVNQNAAGIFVASVNGKYYHLPQCPGAKNISEKNKIWFQTKAEAESRGFKPASNCPDLQNY